MHIISCFPSDYILHRGVYVNKDICSKCEHEKYHKSRSNAKAHGSPHKILRHMPIIEKIQRPFHWKELAMSQGWHSLH